MVFINDGLLREILTVQCKLNQHTKCKITHTVQFVQFVQFYQSVNHEFVQTGFQNINYRNR